MRKLPRVLAYAAFFALLAIVLVFSGCRSAPGEGNPDVVAGASLAGADAPAIAAEIPPVIGGPRTLLVYFSAANATRRVAEDLAALLGADAERIVEKKPRKWGFFGFMGAGASSSFGRATPIVAPARDPATYDAVIVCTPVWAWRMTPPVRSWLRLFRGKLPERCAFVTVSGDTDPAKIVAAMAKEAGRQPAVSTGFADRDFEAENRPAYLAKIASIVDAFRGR